jgi:hypothetical protein
MNRSNSLLILFFWSGFNQTRHVVRLGDSNCRPVRERHVYWQLWPVSILHPGACVCQTNHCISRD